MSDNETQTLLDEAGTLLDQGNYQDAMAAYQKVTDADPSCGEAWRMLGSICGEQGQLDKAADYLQRSVDLDPGDGSAQIALGQVKNALGDTEAAFTCFTEAAARNPEDPLALCALGEMQHRQGDLESAIASYEKAITSDQAPQQAWAMLGYLHLQKGNLSKAEEYYRTAINANHEDSAAVAGWCAAVTQMIDRPAAADTLMQTLLDSKPSDPEICLQLAIATSKLGRHAEALNCIDQALQGAPGTDLYIIGKAEILERKGDLPDCFELLKPYLQSQPLNPTAVLIFAKFSHIVGLKDECLQLLQLVLSNEDLAPEVRMETSAAMDWVNRAKVGGSE